MKTLLAISFLLFGTTNLSAQKVRLEGDNSKYLCLNDSIADMLMTKLKKNNVDSTINILYDYDNGRLSNSMRAVIWTHNGISKIKIVQGCDKIIKDTTFGYDLSSLWEYIRATRFEDITIPIKSGTGQSHDRRYDITITTPTKSFFVVVSDNERKKTEKHKMPESDTRVMLTNKIDQLLK